MEEDHRSILIIGGIEIFLPRSPVEARACVASASTEGNPTKTLKEEEEREKTLIFSPIEKDKHTVEITQWDMELNMLWRIG
jgi:hypothetical protein